MGFSFFFGNGLSLYLPVLLVSYLIGSIPTALWFGKIKYGIDIRKEGSKNSGATNTFRVFGKKAGIFVLTIDVLKGFIVVFVTSLFIVNDNEKNLLFYAGIFTIIGHVFSVFARFKGGKGVATSLGVLIGLTPFIALICLLIFLIVFISTKYVSLGAIIASITFPLLVFLFDNSKNDILLYCSICLCLLVLFAHRKNIQRLLKGSENKMNLFKK